MNGLSSSSSPIALANRSASICVGRSAAIAFTTAMAGPSDWALGIGVRGWGIGRIPTRYAPTPILVPRSHDTNGKTRSRAAGVVQTFRFAVIGLGLGVRGWGLAEIFQSSKEDQRRSFRLAHSPDWSGLGQLRTVLPNVRRRRRQLRLSSRVATLQEASTEPA